MRGHGAGDQADHFVALPIPVQIVEGLEVVQVGVAGHEFAACRQQSCNVLADRNVARKECQGIGVARCLDPDLGDDAYQLGAGSQAEVAPAFRDDESLRKVALIGGGQYRRHRFEVRVLVEDQRCRVGEQDARLATMQLLEIGLGIVVDEGLPVQQPDGLAVFDECHRAQRRILGEDPGHVVDQGLRRQRRDGDGKPLDREVGACRARDLRQHRDFRTLDDPRRPGQHGGRRLRLRAPEKPALSQLDAQVPHDPQLGVRLDAFGDERRPESLGKAGETLQGLYLDRFDVQVVDEVLVDLDDFRTELRPEPQARPAVAEIVEREAQAFGPQRGGGLDQARQVGNVLMLGDLDHDGRRRDGRRLEGAHDAGHREPVHHLDDGERAQVQEQALVMRVLDP